MAGADNPVSSQHISPAAQGAMPVCENAKLRAATVARRARLPPDGPEVATIAPGTVLMNKSILCIAFHFPPVATSSGMQRALKFVRYLREDGWRPVVLTVHPRAYSSCLA